MYHSDTRLLIWIDRHTETVQRLNEKEKHQQLTEAEIDQRYNAEIRITNIHGILEDRWTAEQERMEAAPMQRPSYVDWTTLE